MVGIGVLGSLKVGRSKVGCKGSMWAGRNLEREESYNRDSRENPGGKGLSRRDFLVDVAERVGGKWGKKG